MCPIWPNIYLKRAFLLVLVTCKFNETAIKTKELVIGQQFPIITLATVDCHTGNQSFYPICTERAADFKGGI